MRVRNRVWLFLSAACRGTQRRSFKQAIPVGLGALAALACSCAAARAQGLQLVPTIQTFAGTGTSSYTGDGGLATSATLNSPEGIAFDSNGNTYIGDYYNHRIRLINAQGTISTAYGTGAACTDPVSSPGACGDGGPATNATFEWPAALAFDAAGDLYIIDYGAYRVRRVDAVTGNISTVAGTGISAYNGDGIAATTAGLVGPHGIAIDSSGNIYIADLNGNRIRKISASTGVISTFAGNGTGGYTADGIAATSAEINSPVGIAFDASGDLYIADTGNQRIREVAAGSGLISTIAGNGAAGFSGDGSAATSAELNSPTDVHLDGAGNVYIADSSNGRVREVFAASGLIATIAGSGTVCSPSTGGCGDSGPATSASLDTPAFLGLDPSGDLYIVDQAASRVRTTSPNLVFAATAIGSTTTQNVSVQVTGASTRISSVTVAPSQGAVQEYTVGSISGCVVDGSTLNAIGTICTIPITFRPHYPGSRRLPFTAVTNGGSFHFGLNGIGLGPQVGLSPGTLSTLAGIGTAGYSGDGSGAAAASLRTPLRTTTDAAGNVYIADSGNNVVREVLASNGNILTVAGNGTACATPTASCGDGGLATSANLNAPADVSIDATGNLFIADSGDNRVRRVDANTHVISTYAGNGVAAYLGDGGLAVNASIRSPQQTLVDPGGDLYIVSLGDHTVRFVSQASNIIRTVAGNGTACSSTTAACGDGGAAGGGNSMLHSPAGIALDTSNNLFIADTGDNRIRRVDQATGKISTVAGTGLSGYSGDGAAATGAELNAPHGIAIDAADDLYIADKNNAAIRMVWAATGTIGTIVGNGTQCISPPGACGDTGLANTAALVTPQSVALDSLGNLYIADSGEQRVRAVSIYEPTLSFASTTVGYISPDSPKIETISDIGNAVLHQPPPVSGYNPAVSTGFVFDTASTCLQLTPGSSVALLPVGAPCTYVVDFRPQSTGAFSGAVIGTDNALNAVNATQTVLLQGTATEANSATSLSSSQNPSSFGQTVTLTSHITTTGSGPVPTGTVTFYLVTSHGAINLQAAAASTTTSETLALGVGTYTVSVLGASGGGLYTGWNPALSPSTNDEWIDSYGIELCTSCDATIHRILGDPGYSTAALAQSAYQSAASLAEYDPSSGTTVLVANPYTFTLASPASVSFYVPDGAFSNGAFTDSSSFWDDSGGVSLNLTSLTPIGTGTVNGSAVASLAIATLPIGSDSLLAVYSGDGNYVGSQSPTIVQVVNKAAGPDTLTTSNATPNYGEPITLTDAIPIRNGVSPTGTVTFYNAGISIGTGTVHTVAGVATATLTIATLPVGSDAITAIYSGDGTYAQTTAGPLTLTVTKSTATDTLTTSNATPVYDTAITLTDTIQLVDATLPTGTVTFYNGTTSIGAGTLNGSGVATLITAALPPGVDSITAAYTGDTHYAASTSNTVVETVSRLSDTDTLTVTNTSPGYGQSITLTDAIPILSGVAMTGSVTFYNGATAIGTSPATGGQATLAIATLPVGSDSITAVYSGNTDYNSSTSNALTVTVARLTGSGTLTSSNATPTPAESVTLTDSLTAVNGVAPTGSVTFYNGSTSLGVATLSAGAATLTGLLPVGIDLITAVYSGDTHYNPSTSNALSETVAKLSGADNLTTSNANPTPTQSVTFTDTIPALNSVATTGTVTFYSGSSTLGSVAVVSGTATLTLASLPPGTDVITAVYSGDGNYSSSTSNTVTETVAKLPDTDTLTSSNATPTPTQSVTLTDTIPALHGMALTGTVTFYDGPVALGTAAVSSGTATLTCPLPMGTDVITAVYSGDANYNPSTSNPITETVAKLSAASLLTTSNPTPNLLQSITLTDAVSPFQGVAITGTVTFFNGPAAVGTVAISASGNTSGSAALTLSPLPAGSHAITAVYSGDSNYAASTSNAVTETVAKFSGVDTLTTSNASPTIGQPVTLTDALPTLSGVAPTGTVTFLNGTTVLGTASVTNGFATLSTVSLPVGSAAITAAYSGDAFYNTATAGPVAIVVQPLPIDFTIAATPAHQTVDPGITATYKLALTGLNGAFESPVVLSAAGLPPGATVTFSPATLVPGSGPATTTMTITTSPSTGATASSATPQSRPATRGHTLYLSFALLAFPLLSIRRFHRKLLSLPRAAAILLIAMTALITAAELTGCGGGYFGNAPRQFTIAVTGTSGTLVHSTNVTLAVR